MRGAAFRSRWINKGPGRFSLGIRPLAELVELHHSRKATERHDKIYALLGMAHDFSDAQLQVDYELPWSKLFQNFVKAITSEEVQVDNWDDKETAIMKGLGHVLGEVTEAEGDAASTNLKIRWSSYVTKAFKLGTASTRADWTLPFAATPIRRGDVVCLFQGASRPTVIRPYKDYWAVIRISVTATDRVAMVIPTIEWPRDQATHLSLVWDWDMYQKELQLEDYCETYKKRRGLEFPNAEQEDFLDRVIRLQNLGMGLQDAERVEDGCKRIDMMVNKIEKGLETIIDPESAGGGHTAGGGDDTKLRETFHLLSKSRWPMLALAAESARAIVVKLLLDFNEVDPNRDNFDGNSALMCTVINKHEAVVKLLLKSSRVDPNATNLDGGSPFYGESPVWRAAYEGNLSIFTMLIDSGRIDIGSQQKYGGSPLMYVAKRGHEDIVKMLLETCKVDPDAVGECAATALSWAAESGQEAIVKILLDTGRVNPDGKDNFGCTPLFQAASNGHHGVAELLLSNSQVNPDARAKDDKTPLWTAVANGHEAVVRLLLSTGRVNVNARLNGRYEDGRTPLWIAACLGRTAVVELLLNDPGIDKNPLGRDISRPDRGRTQHMKPKMLWPLQIAKKEEHGDVVKLLKG
ncbi:HETEROKARYON incompatibility protein [Ilyonectria robusta]